MNCKIFVLSVLVGAFQVSAQGYEMDDKDKAMIEECRTQHKLTPEQLKDSAMAKKLPETEDGKCFVECIMEKSGVLEGGKFNLEKAKEINSMKLKDKPEIMAKANTLAEKCSTEAKNPGGKCEYGIEILKCSMKYAKELGIPEPKFSR